MDTYLCNKRLLLKQGGDCVAWQINFPLPHTHLISHEALIQPLLSPLASADWLTYGIALFCFSSSPPVTWEPNSASCQSLLVFVWKRKYRFLFLIHFWALTARAEPPESKRCLCLTWRTGRFLCEQQQTGVTMLCTVMRPPAGVNTCYCSWSIRVLTSRDSNAGIFNDYSESAQRSFILHWLKAHLQHAFDIRVTQGYHTVHHSSCNRSLKGRLH